MAQRKGRGVPICSVVIPAAGSSSRMEGIDKILEPLGELPVLVRTLQVFQSCDLVHEVIVVTREDLIVPVSQLCRDFMLDKVTKVMVGGAERVLSVRIGVQEARRDAALIAIHDGARPLLSREVLEEVLKKAAVTGAAAPAIPMVDTIKRAERGVVVETMDRSSLWAVQTPQVFEASLIRAALEKAVADGETLTDDCAAVERIGMKVSLTRGDRENIKLTTPFDLMVGAACGVLIWFIVYQKAKNARKYRRGAEYGTARWGTAKDIEPFIDPDFSQNILLSETERLTLGKIADPEKRNVNLNVLVIGGSGSGKTRYHIKPNLLQMNASYVCSDPKGTVIEEVGRALVRGGYKIKVLNTIDFSCSMHYNPFVYLHSETDILTLVTVIMTNTQGDAKGGDDFWQKAEALLYQALIAYIYYEAPAEEKNMNTLLDMLNACECREDDENFKSAVDLLFEQLENRNPDHFAVRQYKKFKMAAGKTLKSILISCGARLAPFDIAAVREMMSYDELQLEKLGDEKSALFAVVSDTDPTFNFISAMMYSQMFNVLCDRALKVYHGRLPIHVTCLFDEFANQKIPNWEHLVSVIRSRNISAHIVLQTYSQLKGMYKDNAETVAGCCSTMLFLGGKEESSLKMVSGLLGKETIDTMNESDSRGAQRTYGLNYQKLGKELMSVDELAVMPSSRCIVQVQGVRPFYSKKFDLTKHPQYKYTADANPKYAFDVKAYLEHRLKTKPDEEFEVYDLGEVTQSETAA